MSEHSLRASLLSFVGWLIFSLWSRTLRPHLRNTRIAGRFATEGRPVIYAFWHGSLLLLIGPHGNRQLVILASASRDGEIMAGEL